MILQIYVEKKKEYDSASKKLLYLIKKNVKLEEGADLRIFNKYIIENVGSELYDVIKHRILSDVTVDNVFLDFLPLASDYKQFSVHLPPNSYSADNENIKRCFALCGMSLEPKFRVSTVFAAGKNLPTAAVDAIKRCVATVGFENIPDDRPKNEPKKEKLSKKSVIDGFTKMNDIDVYQFHRKNNIKMSSEEFCKVRDYFIDLGRDPLWIEALSIDSCWSRNDKVTDTSLDSIEIKESALNIPVEIALDEYMTARQALYGDKKVPVTLDDIAKIGLFALKSKGQAADVEYQNGGVVINMPVDIDGVYEQWLLTFKSGKSSDEPRFDYFGGAAAEHIKSRTTPFQSFSLDFIGYDNIKEDKVDFESAKRTAAAENYMAHCGISSQSAKCVVANSESMNVRFTASVAAAPKTNMQKATQGANDTIIMLGGKLTKNSLPIDNAVQRENPQIHQKFQKLIRNPKAAGMIKRCTTLKNGLVCGILDIADDGAVINIDRLLGSDSPDIALAVSEPNERLLILCDRNNAQSIISAARQIGLEANNVAVTDEAQRILFYYKGDILASIDKKILTYKSEAKKSDVIIAAPRSKLYTQQSEEFLKLPLSEAFLKNLSTYNYNENRMQDDKADFAAGGGAVLAPMGGKYQSTPEEASVCKIPAGGKSTNTVTMMSYGSAPRLTACSPFHGAAFSVMESISKIVACGGNSLDIKLSTAEHFLDPATAPIKWSEPLGAMLGAFEAQMSMGLPIIDNAVSIEPVGNFKSAFSFVSFAAATAKTNEIISAEFKSYGSTVLLIPMPTVPKTGMPDFDKAKVLYRQFHYLSQSSKVISASVVKSGGVANAVAKMSFGNSIGVEFTNKDFSTLFGDKTASIIVETKNPGAFSGMDTVKIGKTVEDEHFIFDGVKIPINEAVAAYRTQSDRSFWRQFSKKVTMAEIAPYNKRSGAYSGEKFLKPRVIVPTFSTSLGENELISGFESAGGTASEFAFDFKHINESRETLASLILKSQIIALPDSDSSTFAVNVPVFALSDAEIANAIQTFLLSGGLILGVGGGFNTLLKLGLLGIRADTATLCDNINATKTSALVRTKVISVKSPWLSAANTGDVFTLSAAHSRGRFTADEATISLLAANGRIATQYVDLNDKPTAKQPYNPNGSVCAIEGITSANGNVFGKTALSERYTDGCFANVPGIKDQMLFASGVKYFM